MSSLKSPKEKSPQAEKFGGEKWLNEIRAKDPSALTKAEKEVLQARVSYLTEEEIEKFGLKTQEEAEEDESEREEGEEFDLEEMTVPELKELAEDRGVDVKGLRKKDDLIEALEDAEEKEEDESEDEDEDEGEEE